MCRSDTVLTLRSKNEGKIYEWMCRRIAPPPRGVARDVKVKITMKAAFRCGTQWGLHDVLRNVFRCRSKSRLADRPAAGKNKR